MHDPAISLRNSEDYLVRSTPHRLHTTGQTLQFFQHITGTAPYDPKAIHLLSDYSALEVLERGQSRDAIVAAMGSLQSIWPTFGAFVIEISSMREHHIDLPNEGLRLVNSLASRDQETYAEAIIEQEQAGSSWPALPVSITVQTARELVADMCEIKRHIARPIVWVSHQRPPSQDERYATVNAVRSKIASALKLGAESLGDTFFDPSTLAAEMGQAEFFAKNGEDLDHLTPAAAIALGKTYTRLACRAI